MEKIVGYKKQQGKSLYHVKWLGWSEKENTWEPMENLLYIEGMVREFRKSQNLPEESEEDDEDSGKGGGYSKSLKNKLVNDKYKVFPYANEGYRALS